MNCNYNVNVGVYRESSPKEDQHDTINTVKNCGNLCWVAFLVWKRISFPPIFPFSCFSKLHWSTETRHRGRNTDGEMLGAQNVRYMVYGKWDHNNVWHSLRSRGESAPGLRSARFECFGSWVTRFECRVSSAHFPHPRFRERWVMKALLASGVKTRVRL